MAEPVSITEAKQQCRMVDDNSEDTFLTSLIAPARAFVERRSRFAFVAGSYTETFRRWGDYLEIYRRPIESIDAVTYSVSDDLEDDVAYEGFNANVNAFPVRIYPAFGGNGFPTLVDGQTINVEYTTGALPSTDEAYLIGKRAILFLIGLWFDNRGERPLSKDEEFVFDCILDEISPLSAY